MTDNTISTFLDEINSTTKSFDINVSYDNHGAILYTIITLLFYSLSLFCTLILNIDPQDYSYGKKWAAFQESAIKNNRHENQTDILSELDPMVLLHSLRPSLYF